MPWTLRTIGKRMALGGVLLVLLLSDVAAAPHKHHKPSRHTARHALVGRARRAALAKKAQLRQKLHGIHSHIHQVRAKIHETKVQEHVLKENLQAVVVRLEQARRSLARTDARLELLDTRHQQTQRHLKEAQQRLAQRRQLLAQRIRYNYQRGRTAYTDVLLASRSTYELLSRGYYVRQIVHSDTELIQGVREDIRQIEADKRQLEAQEREQRALAAQFEAEKQQYEADRERKRELLQNVREARAEAQEELDELEAESQEMTERIRALSAALRVRREVMRRVQGFWGGRHRYVPDEAPTEWHGGFIRPASGPITSGFGYRYHPILHYRRMHTGIDFGAGYGAPIHAAGGGTVIFAGYTRGYGNCVIIDHGGGVTTLYGHCSELLVTKDQTVRQEQVIARVGSTGMSTGPHLHFEVRHNGVPVQPF